jgi:hypothetical protein
MCAACVAQGVAYVGGAVAGLQVMTARAKAKRSPKRPPEPGELPPDPDRQDEPATPANA